MADRIPYNPSLYSGHSEFLINERPFGTLIYRSQPNETRDNSKEYAVKVMPTFAMNQRRPHDIRKEALLLSKLEHPNIIEILSIFYDGDKEKYEMLLPFIPLHLTVILSNPYFSAHAIPNELRLSRQNPFPDVPPSKLHQVLTRSIMYQILQATKYLHDQNPPVAHRDINPTNILLTRGGVVKFVDFGVAWDPTVNLKDITIHGEDGEWDDEWIETPDDMCSQVATGAYRAPELMYNQKQYDAVAADLWSLGVLFALFFAPLKLDPLSIESEEEFESSDSESNEETAVSSKPLDAYNLPKSLSLALGQEEPVISPSEVTWNREPLFNADRGEIGLLWSIFQLMGTPTKDTWPDFPGHSPEAVLRFRDAPKRPIAPLLPNLPQDGPSPLNLIEGFLAYPPKERLTAKAVLASEWFCPKGEDSIPILVPSGENYNVDGLQDLSTTTVVDGKSLEELLRELVKAEEARFEDEKMLRDEWD